MIKANVILDYSRWKNKIKDPNSYLKKKIRKLSKIPYFKRKKQEFSILLTNNKKMKSLNFKFRKKNKTTDVLSFPFHNEKFLKVMMKKKKTQIYLGDIIINLSKMKLKVSNEDFFLNFDKIWIHGLAHLMGYRHKSNIDFSIMTSLEKKLIKSLK